MQEGQTCTGVQDCNNVTALVANFTSSKDSHRKGIAAGNERLHAKAQRQLSSTK